MVRRTALMVALTVVTAARVAYAAESGARPSCESLPLGRANAQMGDQESEDDPVVVGMNSTAGDLSSKGGLVAVGANGQAGQVKTTSGHVVIGPNGTVAGIATESGSIEVCSNGRVTGDVVTTTGSITLGMNADVERIVVQKPAALPATPPVIKLGPNSEAGGIQLGYPVRICYGLNSSAGGVSGAKPLPCK